MRFKIILLVAGCCLGQNTLLSADDLNPPRPDDGSESVIVPNGAVTLDENKQPEPSVPIPNVSVPSVKMLSVEPQGESKLPLEHRFWLPKHDLLPGSVDLIFSRAAIMWSTTPEEVKASVDTLLAGETKVSAEEVAKIIVALDDVYSELAKLSDVRAEGFDNRLRDRPGPEIFSEVLPELQQARDFARLLKLKACY